MWISGNPVEIDETSIKSLSYIMLKSYWNYGNVWIILGSVENFIHIYEFNGLSMWNEAAL